MVGSMDSFDFCTELPTTENNAIPLDCWHDICLSNIWIPSHVLPNRSKPSNTRVTQGVYHTLEKKDSLKYTDSFSIYSFSDVESEQGEIFVSDSDEDFFGSDSTSFEKLETLSDNTLPAVTDLVCPLNNAYSNDIGSCIETDVLNKNSERKDNENINPKANFIANEGNSSYLNEMYHGDAEKVKEVITSEENIMNCEKNLEDGNDVEKVREVIGSEENLMNSRKNLGQGGNVSVKNLSKSGTESQMNFTVLKKFHDVKTSDFKDGVMQTSRKGNKDSDSFISLNEILDVTSEISMKDFAYDLKKRSDRDFLCAYDNQEKNSKKNKKNKGKKKPSKYITLDKFLEDSVDISQDSYCDQYFQNILKERYKNGSNDVLIGSKAEFPSLATEECKFIHSDKTRKEINKNENFVDVDEIKPSMTDTKYGKIIIENIPLDVTKEDLSLILCGYGEIKNLSLVSIGNFLTAFVEIDLICDIDWIIECLNGSESFGASTEKLKCNKQ